MHFSAFLSIHEQFDIFEYFLSRSSTFFHIKSFFSETQEDHNPSPFVNINLKPKHRRGKLGEPTRRRETKKGDVD